MDNGESVIIVSIVFNRGDAYAFSAFLPRMIKPACRYGPALLIKSLVAAGSQMES
jgi:hypothetical protein